MPRVKPAHNPPASPQQRLNSLRASIARIKLHRNAVAPSDGLAVAIARLRDRQAAAIDTEALPIARRLASAYSAGIPSPVLSICGRGTQEIRFTRYLAYFLDPSRPHGLGASLLRAILQGYASEDQLAEMVQECRVVPEMHLGQVSYGERQVDSYCDIGVVSPRLLVLIEHKILSGQSNHPGAGMTQLKRYDRAIAENPLRYGRDLLRIFLTPGGHVPDESEWLPMSHAQLVGRAAVLLDQATIPIVAKENLRRLLIDLITGPYEREENESLELVRAALAVAAGAAQPFEIRRFQRLVSSNKVLVGVLQGGLKP